MPQFDVSTYPSQIFWLFVTFTLLYFLMSRVALPRIGEVLERRQKTIEDNLAKARLLKEDSDAAIATYEAALAEARSTAQEVIRTAVGRITAEQADKTAALAEKLAAEGGAAEDRIAKAKDQALSQVDALAAEIARDATDRLIGIKVQTKTAEKAVEAVKSGNPGEVSHG